MVYPNMSTPQETAASSGMGFLQWARQQKATPPTCPANTPSRDVEWRGACQARRKVRGGNAKARDLPTFVEYVTRRFVEKGPTRLSQSWCVLRARLENPCLSRTVGLFLLSYLLSIQISICIFSLAIPPKHFRKRPLDAPRLVDWMAGKTEQTSSSCFASDRGCPLSALWTAG